MSRTSARQSQVSLALIEDLLKNPQNYSYPMIIKLLVGFFGKNVKIRTVPDLTLGFNANDVSAISIYNLDRVVESLDKKKYSYAELSVEELFTLLQQRFNDVSANLSNEIKDTQENDGEDEKERKGTIKNEFSTTINSEFSIPESQSAIQSESLFTDENSISPNDSIAINFSAPSEIDFLNSPNAQDSNIVLDSSYNENIERKNEFSESNENNTVNDESLASWEESFVTALENEKNNNIDNDSISQTTPNISAQNSSIDVDFSFDVPIELNNNTLELDSSSYESEEEKYEENLDLNDENDFIEPTKTNATVINESQNIDHIAKNELDGEITSNIFISKSEEVNKSNNIHSDRLSFSEIEKSLDLKDSDDVEIEWGSDSEISNLLGIEVCELPISFEISVNFLGLYGSSSPLPIYYSEGLIRDESEENDSTKDFLNILNAPYYSAYIKGTQKYNIFDRVTSVEDLEIVERLFMFAGLSIEEIRNKHQNIYEFFPFLGLFSMVPRSKAGLLALLKREFSNRVSIDDFVPQIMDIPKEQYMSLGEKNSSLGEDAYLGTKIRTVDNTIRINITCKNLKEFVSLQPGNRKYRKLQRLLSLYMLDRLSVMLHIALKNYVPKGMTIGIGNSLGFNSYLGQSLVKNEELNFDTKLDY